jgi:hypothetical protein
VDEASADGCHRMTALELVQMITSSGVLVGGLGLLKWGLTVERRLMKVEVKTGVDP